MPESLLLPGAEAERVTEEVELTLSLLSGEDSVSSAKGALEMEEAPFFSPLRAVWF